MGSRALTDSRERPRGPGFKEQQGAPLKSERLSSMLLFLLLGFLPILARVVWVEAVTVDTDECLRGAKARHGDDPNDELDSFLACVLARLDAVETSDKEVLNLKSQLAAIEDMPSFGKNGFKHNLAKRQAEEEEEVEE